MNKLEIDSVNNQAFMTLDLKSTWLTNFDNSMKREKKNAILFLDNTHSYPHISFDVLPRIANL